MSRHAIIIDDNVKNLSVLAQLLAEQGVTSTQITNPRTMEMALNAVTQADVVFVDLEMPGMDGFGVLEKLKADPRFANAPFVAYTVHISEISVAHARGFDAFIGKPIDPDRFPDQLARIFRGEPVWETL